MVLKVQMILFYTFQKSRLVTILGRDAFLRVFGSVKKAAVNTAQEKIFRVINGEIMGKKLDKPGEGTPQVDPEMCQHPQDQVIRKSNKSGNNTNNAATPADATTTATMILISPTSLNASYVTLPHTNTATTSPKIGRAHV